MEMTINSETEKCFEKEKKSCKNCVPQEVEIKHVELARAYVPFQKYCTTYMPIESLMNGTAFSELHMPYTKKCNCN
jgi:hypothetical protein